MTERERKRRRMLRSWGPQFKRGASKAWNKYKMTPANLAKRLASSPAAMAVLSAGVMATAAIGYTEVATNRLDDRLASVEATVSDAEQVVADMRTETAALHGKADDLITDVSRLAAAVAEGDDALADDIAGEAAERSVELRNQATRLEDMAGRLTALEEDPVSAEAVQALSDDVDDVAAQLASTASTLTTLTGSVEAVRSDLDQAEGALASVAALVQDLETGLSSTNATVAAIADQLDSVTQQASDAQTAADTALARAPIVAGDPAEYSSDTTSTVGFDLEVAVDGDYLVTVSSKIVAYSGAGGGSCVRSTHIDGLIFNGLRIAGNATPGPSYTTSTIATLSAGPIRVVTIHSANVPHEVCTYSSVTVSLTPA